LQIRLQERTLPDVMARLICFAAGVLAAAPLTGAVAAGAAALSDSYTVVYGARVEQAIPTPSALALRIGRPDSLAVLVDRLLSVAEEFVGLPGGLPRPGVTLLQGEELGRRLCGGPCAVRAAYVPGEGLLIDRQMRPDVNAFHQSILFHELVHHVQVVRGVFGALGRCQMWQARESQAYALQNRFLGALGSSQRAIDPTPACSAEARAPATRYLPHTFGSSSDPSRVWDTPPEPSAGRGHIPPVGDG
jgi:hypothetical protein